MRYGRCIICAIQWKRCAGNDITVNYARLPPADTVAFPALTIRFFDFMPYSKRVLRITDRCVGERSSLIKDYIIRVLGTRDGAIFGTIEEIIFFSIFFKGSFDIFLGF